MMKSYLQLNIDSPFNKNYYRTRRHKLEITKETQQNQYTFDNICYSAADINSSIVYDIVMDYSQAQKEDVGSTASIDIKDPINSYANTNNNNNVKPKQQAPKSHAHQPQRHSSSASLSYLSSSLLDQIFKPPAFNYTILYDQISEAKQIQSLIKELCSTQIFKKQSIKIGHFIAHENGIYDFHRKRTHITETERKELEKQNQIKNVSIEDNFMWIYNKEINLCEEIKLNNIEHLLRSISYISIKEFHGLLQPTLGVQLVGNITKAEEIKHKELQNKKILEIFVVYIGKNIRVNLVLFNYNKNYQFNNEEAKEIQQLFMMYGVTCGKIKYQTVKAQILCTLLQNLSKLYYVMYFPGPKLSIEVANIAPQYRKSSFMTNSIMQPMANKPPQQSNLKQLYLRDSYLKSSMISHYSQNSQAGLSRSQTQTPSKTARPSPSPEKADARINELLTLTFDNYTSLLTKDKQNLQKIIKEYLLKKQENLKAELERIKERVKQLKLNQRIQQSEVMELKGKCMKALEKMSISIIELQKMGITNVERYMDWVKGNVDDKKVEIKQLEEQIQQIHKKTIESKHSHNYFYKKMLELRDRLAEKYQALHKSDEKQKMQKILTEQKQKQHEKGEKQNMKNHKSYLNILSLSQLQQLEHHKQKLKSKLVEKLKNSSEKKKFNDGLAEIRGKVSKLELTRLQQKYFDLLHD